MKLIGTCRICGGTIEPGSKKMRLMDDIVAFPTRRDRETARRNPGAIRGPYACSVCTDAIAAHCLAMAQS